MMNMRYIDTCREKIKKECHVINMINQLDRELARIDHEHTGRQKEAHYSGIMTYFKTQRAKRIALGARLVL